MNPESNPLILIVDDNATDVFFLKNRLATANIHHPIHRVEDGAEAVAWLDRHFNSASAEHSRLHLIFLDLNMPRLDGFAVLAWIREHDLCDRLTVVVLTTSAEPEDRARAAKLGAHDYLVKYPKADELQRVHALATQRGAVHAS